ncbi:MAG: tRNA (adenosine(37)-N6)-threonylcarbamoyltransferase complex transferase subunit TsaD [Patescibacteria group bacterium]
MQILAIESSCDETAVAVLKGTGTNFEFLSNMVFSQVATHAKFGGVVPEVAARMHIETIIPLLREALSSAKINLKELDAIAVTSGPGLMSSLMIGVETAKALSFSLNIPLIKINHLEGHLFSCLKNSLKEIKFPAVGLIVSGGHTQILFVENFCKYKIIGETRDDAVGEAFDKVAKILHLGYPGGPAISKAAAQTDENHGFAIKLPRPMLDQHNYEMSFSGIKTSVLYLWQKNEKNLTDSERENFKKAIAFEFQQAVVEVLATKILLAAREFNAKTVLLGGGVSANTFLKNSLQKIISDRLPKVKFLFPETKMSGDNAAMIAVAGFIQAKKKNYISPLKLKADPNLELV